MKPRGLHASSWFEAASVLFLGLRPELPPLPPNPPSSQNPLFPVSTYTWALQPPQIAFRGIWRHPKSMVPTPQAEVFGCSGVGVLGRWGARV